MRIKNRKVIIVAALILICSAAAYGQRKEVKPDTLAAVPAARRARLIQRLELFVAYYRTREWNKLYDLLGEQAKAYVEGGLSRERFLKELPKPKLNKFKPDIVSLMLGTEENGIWIIWGCGEYSRAGPDEKLRSTIEAYFQNGDWYFSEVGTPAPLHGNPEKCR